MQLRRLGRSDLVTAPIGLNAVSFTRGCGPVDADEADAVLAHAIEVGAVLIDATDLTGSGEVELLVGRATRGRRDEVVLAGRGGARYTGRGQLIAVDARPASISRSCDLTLRRLGTDHLDLYYLDRVDPWVPFEDSVGALAGLVAAGKARHIGLSHVDGDELRRAHAVHPVTVVAVEYSLLHRDIESELLPTARALGVGLAAYRPLGRGLLTGTFASLDELPVDDYRRADPRFRPRAFARSRAVARVAEQVASHRDVGTGRLALTWLLAQGVDVVPVPGTASLTHLEMNLAAADLRLEPDELALLGSGAAASSQP